MNAIKFKVWVTNMSLQDFADIMTQISLTPGLKEVRNMQMDAEGWNKFLSSSNVYFCTMAVRAVQERVKNQGNRIQRFPEISSMCLVKVCVLDFLGQMWLLCIKKAWVFLFLWSDQSLFKAMPAILTHIIQSLPRDIKENYYFSWRESVPPTLIW